MPNTPIRFDKDVWGMDADWQPNNSDGKYGGMVSLKFGLANSLNTISARIMHSFGPGAGPERVVKMARSMGVKSNLIPVPSLALGVADLSVYEMVGANSTFANKGVYIEPIILTRIEDKHGNVIYDVIPKTTEAMDEETAYLMLVLMKGVCDGVYNPETGKRSSTGGRVRFRKSEKRPYGGIKYPIAGKTGTTQNNSDGWFIGITPDLVTGVWTGAEDRSVHFESTAYGQGANMALPIWGYYMNKIYDDKSIKISTGDFEKPAYLETVIDCDVFDDVNAPLVEPGFGDDDGDDIY
jgi:penicillin-binding protein 1A